MLRHRTLENPRKNNSASYIRCFNSPRVMDHKPNACRNETEFSEMDFTALYLSTSSFWERKSAKRTTQKAFYLPESIRHAPIMLLSLS